MIEKKVVSAHAIKNARRYVHDHVSGGLFQVVSLVEKAVAYSH